MELILLWVKLLFAIHSSTQLYVDCLLNEIKKKTIENFIFCAQFVQQYQMVICPLKWKGMHSFFTLLNTQIDCSARILIQLHNIF